MQEVQAKLDRFAREKADNEARIEAARIKAENDARIEAARINAERVRAAKADQPNENPVRRAPAKPQTKAFSSLEEVIANDQLMKQYLDNEDYIKIVRPKKDGSGIGYVYTVDADRVKNIDYALEVAKSSHARIFIKKASEWSKYFRTQKRVL